MLRPSGRQTLKSNCRRFMVTCLQMQSGDKQQELSLTGVYFLAFAFPVNTQTSCFTRKFFNFHGKTIFGIKLSHHSFHVLLVVCFVVTGLCYQINLFPCVCSLRFFTTIIRTKAETEMDDNTKFIFFAVFG